MPVPIEPAPMTAALRSGGQAAEPLPLELDAGPDSRGHLARRGAAKARSTRGNVSGRPQRTRTLHGRMLQPAARALGASTATGTTGAPVSSASRPTPRCGLPERAAADPRALGEDHDDVAALEDRLRGGHRLLVGLAAPERERAERVQEPAHQAVLEQLALGDEVDRPPQAAADHERVEEAAVVRGEDQRPVGGEVLAPVAAEAEPELDRAAGGSRGRSSRRAC